jgi:signal transduction histidine kinase
MKIQYKIALLFTGLCSLVILLLSLAIYFFSNEHAFEDFYVRLELRANIASKMNFDSSEVTQEAYSRLRREHLQRLPEEEEYILRADTLDRLRETALYKTLTPDFFNQVISTGKASTRRHFRFYAGILSLAPDGDHIIIVTAVHSYAQNFLANLKTILIAASVISAVVLFSIGLLFARQVLFPIRTITRRVNTISATSLHERLPPGKGTDELSTLAATFNDMLSRLETAFESQNNFVSNASHELNTPLTAIIGEADLALTRDRPAEDYRESLAVIMQEAEKLRTITRGLLELAQSGFTGAIVYEEVNIEELLHDVLQVARNVYPTVPIDINRSLWQDGGKLVRIHGNARLFELALSNILLNACKYSEGRPVTVAVATSGAYVHFVITDRGIGIPETEIGHIFEPFFRASNVLNTRGYGIGLPLSLNIVKLYKGSIEIHSRQGSGTEVIVRFPIL